MKKILCFLIVIILCMSCLSISSAAIVTDEENTEMSQQIDLSQYTLEELCSMSAEDYYELCNAYDRIYDPFGDYEERNSQSENENTMTRWLSESGTPGDDDYIPGSHAKITAQAMLILQNDGRLWCNDPVEAVTVTILLSIASEKPDQNAVTYVGHFYNPETEKNYMGMTSPTAKTFAVYHYDNAIDESVVDVSLDEIGRCLHFVQDIYVPHHTALVIGTNLSHTKFEKYASDRLDTYLSGAVSTPVSTYNYVNNISMGEVMRQYAQYSYARIGYVDEVDEINDNTSCPAVALSCTQLAAKLSAAVLYKYSRNTNLV